MSHSIGLEEKEANAAALAEIGNASPQPGGEFMARAIIMSPWHLYQRAYRVPLEEARTADGWVGNRTGFGC